MSQSAGKPQSRNVNRLRRRLLRESAHAIKDYAMIAPGDTVMVCLSGGKDSYTLLELLREHRRRAPFDFELIAMNLDQRQPGFPAQVLPDYLRGLAQRYHIEREDTYAVVRDKLPAGATMCSLCSRLRRGIIYRVAGELGANKIALGHHREDILETFFLNLFHGGRLKAMPPKLLSDDRRHTVIRPLAYSAEADIARFARAQRYPIIPCNLCGSQPNLQRQAIKAQIAAWERQWPGRTAVMFRALAHLSPSHLLDRAQFDFGQLGGAAELAELDTLFDPPALPAAPSSGWH